VSSRDPVVAGQFRGRARARHKVDELRRHGEHVRHVGVGAAAQRDISMLTILGPSDHRQACGHGAALSDVVGDRVAQLGMAEILVHETAVGPLTLPGVRVLASSAPKGAAGMHGWAPEVIGAIGTPKTSPEEYLDVFFAKSASSQQAGKEALGRMYARTLDRDQATTWATRQAQYDAVCAWGIPDHALLQRLSGIDLPVFVANGDSDPMILPRFSYLLAGLIPHAGLKIYPDSAHGFLFQHHAEFAADVEAFLA